MLRTKIPPPSFNCRYLAAPFGAIEVGIKADDCKPVALRNHVLVSIIEVEAEPLGRIDEAFHLMGREGNNGNPHTEDHIFYELPKYLVFPSAEEQKPYGVEGIIGRVRASLALS